MGKDDVCGLSLFSRWSCGLTVLSIDVHGCMYFGPSLLVIFAVGILIDCSLKRFASV